MVGTADQNCSPVDCSTVSSVERIEETANSSLPGGRPFGRYFVTTRARNESYNDRSYNRSS